MTDEIKQAIVELINKNQHQKLQLKKAELQKIVSKLTAIRNGIFCIAGVSALLVLVLAFIKYF